MSTIAEIAEALGGRPRGSGWDAHCPAHDDQNPSLSIDTADDGRPLFYCHAGCSYDAILDALRARGLCPETSRDSYYGPQKQKHYPLLNPEGGVVAIHVPIDGKASQKKFVWTQPNGSHGLAGKPVADLPLYGGEILLRIGLSERPIIVTEGEKCCDALKSLGYLSVGTVTGASTIPSDAVLETLRGRRVILWADNDDVGTKHMHQIAGRLAGMGTETRVIRWDNGQNGADAADLVGGMAADSATETIDALIEAAQQASEVFANNAERKRVRRPAMTMFSEISAEPISWLWQDFIPRGQVTLMVGAPGTGKSTVSQWLAAAISEGRALPGDVAKDAATVVIASCEESAGYAILPRLEVSGADLSRVVNLAGVHNGDDDRDVSPLSLADPEDMRMVQQVIELKKAKLFIVDVISGYLSDVDLHRSNEMRAVMTALRNLAEATGAAVLILTHLNKSASTEITQRVMGSIDIIAAPRSVLLIGRDPSASDDQRAGVLLRAKANLPGSPDPQGFTIQADGLLRWTGPRPEVTAAQLLAPRANAGTVSDASNEVLDWLRELLAEGPRHAPEVLAAGNAKGFSDPKIRRAYYTLGGSPQKTGYSRQAKTMWGLGEASSSPTWKR